MDSMYGKSLAPITMVLEKSLESFEQESTMNKVFSQRKTKKFADKYTALSAMDGFSPVGENGAYPDTDMTEVFSKTLEPMTWKNKFSVTREMIEDGNTDTMAVGAKKFSQSYHRTREMFMVELLTKSVGATTKVQFGGKNFDATCADGKALFNTAHPNFYKASKTQSNLFSNAFSNEVLVKMETAMQGFKDDKDNLLAVTPDTIIIPNDAQLKYDVFAAIGADKDPATANNGYNYNYGRWNVIVCPYWTVTGEDKPFILMDSRFNDVEGTAIMLDRIGLQVEAYEDKDTDAGIYKGRSRFTAGFNNWRGMAMGGVTGGTTLA